VVVLDHGSGNLRSAERALVRAGADVEVTADLDAATEADGLVVPGVGAFAACMAAIHAVRGGTVVWDRLRKGRPGARHLRRACRSCSRPVSSTASARRGSASSRAR
jgi:imidazoleglycerol phosphate synthase glutamine amidotransferase subunit HisH